MSEPINRKHFLKSVAGAGAGMTLASGYAYAGVSEAGQSARVSPIGEPARVGIIGLDTSHSPAFTRLINRDDNGASTGFRVTAAYPYGSRTIESVYNNIPRYTEQVKGMGVEIVDSIQDLVSQVDFVLLETNDGKPRLEQAIEVMEAGKIMYMDKPVAGSLKDAVEIVKVAERLGAPVYTCSSLRYMKEAQQVRHNNAIGDVTGADAFSPASLEPSHPDLFWYGIHGVETLFTVMETGCHSVTRTQTEGTELVVGTWEDDRIGTFRGTRAGRSGYGGIAYGTDGIMHMTTFEGYGPMIVKVLEYFRSGVSPVAVDEMLEIYAFMEAADESKRRNGAPVTLAEVLSEAGA